MGGGVMSRTVKDLVDAIGPDEEYRFDPEAVWQGSLRRARQRRVRRSAVMLAAGVAAVAAIATPTMILTAGSRGLDPMTPGGSASSAAAPTAPTATPTTSTAPPVAGPTWSETLREVAEGDWLILPTETNAYLQRANVLRAAGPELVATVEVYEPGAFDQSLVLEGAQTTVDGVTAYFAWVPNPFLTTGETQRALAWEYAPDAWVAVRVEPEVAMPATSTPIPDELLEIASRVEIAAPEPVRLPFQVGYRPAGLVPHSVTHFSAAYPDRTVYYESVGEPISVWDPQRDVKFPLHLSMRPAEPDQWRPNTAVGGRPAMSIGVETIVSVNDDLWVDIGVGAAADPLPMEELELIYAGLTFADWSDQSTWFDANSAV
jgi:hypothetical protein